MNTVIGWCFIIGGLALLLSAAAFWVTAPIRAARRKTRPSAMGGGKSAGYARGVGCRAAKASESAPEAADTAPESAGPPSGATPTVARAVLTPDCPSLDTEYWRKNPTEPLAPSEICAWRAIVARYEWVAAPVVKGHSDV